MRDDFCMYTRKRFLKIISLVTLTIFSLSIAEPAFARKSTFVPKPSKVKVDVPQYKYNIEKLDPAIVTIPSEFGTVKETYKGTNGKLIVHIQDAHTNYNAQKNEAGIIEHLINNYKLKLVLLEGGTRDDNIDFLRQYASAQKRVEVAEKHLKKGAINCAEYLDLAADYDLDLQGVEDVALYDANVEAFKRIDEFKERSQAILKAMKGMADMLKPKLFHKALNDFDETQQKYNNDRITLVEFYQYMGDTAQNLKLDLSKYPNFHNFIKSNKLEGKINLDKANEERAKLLDNLSNNLPKEDMSLFLMNSMDYKQGRASSKIYYEQLQDLARKIGVSIRKTYPNLYKYIEYASKVEIADVDGLFKEVDNVESEIKDKLFKNDDQRKLDEIQKDIALLQNFLNISLAPGDLNRFESNRDKFNTTEWLEFLQGNIKKHKLANPITLPTDVIDNNLQDLYKFYEAAKERDIAIIRNLERIMTEKGEELAALPLGGFHTEQVVRLLREKGYSYIVVAPKVSEVTDMDRYHYMLLNENYLSLKEVLESDKRFKDLASDLNADKADEIIAARNNSTNNLPLKIYIVSPNGIKTERSFPAGSILADVLKGLLTIPVSASGYDIYLNDQQVAKDGVIADPSLSVSPNDTISFKPSLASDSSLAADKVTTDKIKRTIGNLELVAKLPEPDKSYLLALVDKYSNQEGARLKIGESFTASAFLTPKQHDAILGAVDYKNDIFDIKAYLKAAKDVELIVNPMDGGVGANIERGEYLENMAEKWPKKFSMRGKKPNIGAKGLDYYFEVEHEGVKVPMNISEIKYRRLIKESGDYKGIKIQELVNDESQKSMNDFLKSFGSVINKGGGVELAKNIVQLAFPVVDLSNYEFTDIIKLPGGHGQLGTIILYDAERMKIDAKAAPVVRAIYNGDGVNNGVDPYMVGWMVEEGVPIAMVTATKMGLDIKGGLMGAEKVGDTHVAQIMELAQAVEAGQEKVFYEIGLPNPKYMSDKLKIEHRPGNQFFNTNTAIVNYAVLTPFLKELKNQIGEEQFYRIITPDLMSKPKEKEIERDGKIVTLKYLQLEGALGSSLLNLNRFILTDPGARRLWHNMSGGKERFLRIINLSPEVRTDFFTPYKYAVDVWLQSQSNHFSIDTQNWRLEKNPEGGIKLPKINDELAQHPYYMNIQNVIDAFGNASTIGLDSLEITLEKVLDKKGKLVPDPEKGVKLEDAILRGNVKIHSAYPGIFDLNEHKESVGVEKNKLLLENVMVDISASGGVTVTPLSMDKDIRQSLEGKETTNEFRALLKEYLGGSEDKKAVFFDKAPLSLVDIGMGSGEYKMAKAALVNLAKSNDPIRKEANRFLPELAKREFIEAVAERLEHSVIDRISNDIALGRSSKVDPLIAPILDEFHLPYAFGRNYTLMNKAISRRDVISAKNKAEKEEFNTLELLSLNEITPLEAITKLTNLGYGPDKVAELVQGNLPSDKMPVYETDKKILAEIRDEISGAMALSTERAQGDYDSTDANDLEMALDVAKTNPGIKELSPYAKGILQNEYKIDLGVDEGVELAKIETAFNSLAKQLDSLIKSAPWIAFLITETPNFKVIGQSEEYSNRFLALTSEKGLKLTSDSKYLSAYKGMENDFGSVKSAEDVIKVFDGIVGGMNDLGVFDGFNPVLYSAVVNALRAHQDKGMDVAAVNAALEKSAAGGNSTAGNLKQMMFTPEGREQVWMNIINSEERNLDKFSQWALGVNEANAGIDGTKEFYLRSKNFFDGDYNMTPDAMRLALDKESVKIVYFDLGEKDTIISKLKDAGLEGRIKIAHISELTEATRENIFERGKVLEKILITDEGWGVLAPDVTVYTVDDYLFLAAYLMLPKEEQDRFNITDFVDVSGARDKTYNIKDAYGEKESNERLRILLNTRDILNKGI